MKTKLHKLIIIVCAAVLSAVLVGFVSYAAYTNLNSVKRVVSTQGGKGTAFSSNYLNLIAITSEDTNPYPLKNISFPPNSETISFEINVCNYVQNNPSRVNESDITYDFILELIKDNAETNLEGLTVKDKSGATHNFTNGVCTISGQKLTGKTRSVDTYTVTVPKSFIGKIQIKATAKPDSASYSATDNFKLGRIFTFSDYSAAATTWTGSFSETTTEGFDGFNYVIKGQGKGTVTLTWNYKALEINKVFIENNGLTVTTNGDVNIIEMLVDSAVQGRYNIQFYKTESGNYTDMETLNGYVTISFAESNESG